MVLEQIHQEVSLNYSYETYPLLKAQSLGFEVKCFHDVAMATVRPTKQYKADYGYGMRELGYSLPYVLGKCIISLPRAKSKSIKLLCSYLTSPYRPQDPYLKRFMKHYQAKQFTNFRVFIKLLG